MMVKDLQNLVYLHAAYAIDLAGLTYTTGNDELHVAFRVQFVDASLSQSK